MPRRRGNLRFSHHQEVAYIEDPVMQDKLLDWAEQHPKTLVSQNDRSVKPEKYLKEVVSQNDRTSEADKIGAAIRDKGLITK